MGPMVPGKRSAFLTRESRIRGEIMEQCFGPEWRDATSQSGEAALAGDDGQRQMVIALPGPGSVASTRSWRDRSDEELYDTIVESYDLGLESLDAFEGRLQWAVDLVCCQWALAVGG